MSGIGTLPPFKLFNAVDISTDQTSQECDVREISAIGMTIAWTGTSPVGEIFVEASNHDLLSNIAAEWVALDFGSSIAVSGNSGTHLVDIEQFPYRRIRVRYARSSGVGSLTVVIHGKAQG